MQVETSIGIDAAASSVWDVLIDVERWPTWTESIDSVERLDTGPLAVGSRVRVKQPKLPAVVWLVTALDPGRSFTWSVRSSGMTSVAAHAITANAGGGVTATLSIRQSGPMAPIVALFTSGLTRRYVQTEAQGLKRRCEAG